MDITVWMVFEALGPDKDGVEQSLDDHVETIKNEKGIELKELEEDEAEKMEDPHPEMDEGYSKVVEMRAEFDSFNKVIETVINYGPTYVQVEEPDTYDLSLQEAQNTVQDVATTMHQYAQMGAGGILISKNADQNS